MDSGTKDTDSFINAQKLQPSSPRHILHQQRCSSPPRAAHAGKEEKDQNAGGSRPGSQPHCSGQDIVLCFEKQGHVHMKTAHCPAARLAKPRGDTALQQSILLLLSNLSSSEERDGGKASQPGPCHWGQGKLPKAHSYPHAAKCLPKGMGEDEWENDWFPHQLSACFPKALVQYKRGFVHTAVLKPGGFLGGDTTEHRGAAFICNL